MASLPRATEPETDRLLTAQGVSLQYGELNALKAVDFSINKGEILAVVGEHGAGKSTLGRIISGGLRPDAGTFSWQDKRLPTFGAHMARTLGIELVPQQSELFPRLSVAENLFINNRRFFTHAFYENVRIIEKARVLLRAVDSDIDPRVPSENLSLSDRIFIEILRHLEFNPAVLILDEALEKLTQTRLNNIISILRTKTEAGMAVVFITHRVEDVYSLADRVAIMRNGEIIFTDSVKQIDKISLIKLAYTQLLKTDNSTFLHQEFHDLIKYNEAIIEYLPINLLIVDQFGKIRFVNNFARALFDLGPENVMMGSAFDIFLLGKIAVEESGISEQIQDSLSSREPHNFFDIRVTVRGKTRRVNILTHPVVDGEVRIGCMILVDDITDQEKLREQVLLSEKLASVGLLAAGVAHEINNPLSAMFNYLDLLKNEGQTETQSGIISKIESEFSSIEDIVSNLIAFYDKKSKPKQLVDVDGLIREILDLVTYHAAYQGITINFKPADGAFRIHAARTEIKQAVLNLIRNSLEAMPSGGTLDIRTMVVETGTDNQISVVFEDDGPGIPSEHLGAIFQPFFSTKSGKQGNMGLGLSLTYGIVVNHGGQIEAENRPLRGCCFRMTFPAVPAIDQPG